MMSVSFGRRVLCAASVCAMLAIGAAPAAASPSATAWWYEAYGVAEVHSEGWTGAGVKIAVVDSQINPELPVFAGADLRVDTEPLNDDGIPPIDTEPTDSASHGTNVTALIVGHGAGPVQGIAPDAEVVFYGTGPDDADVSLQQDDGEPTEVGRGIQRAVGDGARIINVSLVTNVATADLDIIAEALNRDVIIVAGTPNGTVGSPGYPGEYNGVVSVNAIDDAGQLKPDEADESRPNLHEEVTVVAPGVDVPIVGVFGQSWEGTETRMGSSYAAPLVTGMLAIAAQRYPDATGNQLIQALIRTTGGETHEPERILEDGFGYGVASLRGLVGLDPTTLPDENPLMDKSFGFPDEFMLSDAAGSSVGSTPGPAATDEPAVPTEPDEDSSGDATTVAIVAVAVLVVLVLAAGVVVLAMRNRRNRDRSSNGGRR